MSAAHDLVGANPTDALDFPGAPEAKAAEPAPEAQKAMTHAEAIDWLVQVSAAIASLDLDVYLDAIRQMELMPLDEKQREGLRVMKGTVKAAQPLRRFVLEESRRLQARKGKT